MSKVGWKNLARRTISWDGAPWVFMVFLALVVGVALSWIYWGDLHHEEESLSTTVRNVALVIGGVIAVLLAVWRSRVAERQAATAQQGLLNERYQKGAEMLGSRMLAVRLGGIYALRRLAGEYPEQYHIQVMSLLCAFVRLPSPNNGIESYPQIHEGQSQEMLALRADVQDAMQAVALRGSVGISMEAREKD